MLNDRVRIGVFYDGGFFHHVNNFFNYEHSEKKWISLKGLHDLIKGVVAHRYCSNNIEKCKITEAHYFRGRFNAHDASDKNFLFRERAFEDLLLKEDISLNYRLLSSRNAEKGVDVSLALNAYEAAVQKRVDLIALIASDGDFVPLVKKIEIIGVPVMIVGCNFEFYKYDYIKQQTITNYNLLQSVSIPFLLNEFADKKFPVSDTDKQKYFNDLLKGLFVDKQDIESSFEPKVWGNILSLKDSYGFIKSSQFPENIFFHHSQVQNCSFDDLEVGDDVEFLIGDGFEGPCAIDIERVSSKITKKN